MPRLGSATARLFFHPLTSTQLTSTQLDCARLELSELRRSLSEAETTVIKLNLSPLVERSRNEQPNNGKYYTGSTRNLERRLEQHKKGEGANFTRKHLPVKLMYYEEFDRIDDAFYREKQIQGWSHAKKEALINGDKNKLHELAKCSSRLRSTSGRRSLSAVEVSAVEVSAVEVSAVEVSANTPS